MRSTLFSFGLGTKRRKKENYYDRDTEKGLRKERRMIYSVLGEREIRGYGAVVVLETSGGGEKRASVCRRIESADYWGMDADQR